MEPGDNLLVKKVLFNVNTEEIDNYIKEVLSRDIKTFYNAEKIENYFPIGKIIDALSSKEIANLRYYTGNNYDKINALLRSNWNYDNNGLLTKENEKMYTYFANEIAQVFNKNINYNLNFYTHRYVDIDFLKPYGITKIEDIGALKNKFLFDLGFTSSSLLDNNLFDNFQNKNIKLDILIPQECKEGIPLLGDFLSFHPDEYEFLIEPKALFKVVDATFDKNINKANLKIVLIPRELYINYENEKIRGL